MKLLKSVDVKQHQNFSKGESLGQMAQRM